MALNSLRRVATDSPASFDIDELLRKQRWLDPTRAGGEGQGIATNAPPVTPASREGLVQNPVVTAPVGEHANIFKPAGPQLPELRRISTDAGQDAPLASLPQPSLPRQVAQPPGDAPTMIATNDKGRPLRAIGGADPVTLDRELLRHQEQYQAPRSTKDQILSFLTGGIPGGVAYATDQDTRNKWANGQDVSNTEGRIKRNIAYDQEQAQTENMQAQPEIQRRRIAEQEAATQSTADYHDRQLREQQAQHQAVIDRADADREARRLQSEADRAQRELTRKEEERHHRELEKQGGSDKVGTRQGEERQRKLRGAQTEYDSLISEEANALKAKDAAYKVYSDLANAVDAQGKPTASKEDVAASSKAAEDANTYYRGFGDKKRKAQSAIQENYVEPTVNTDLMPKPTHGMSRATFRKNNPAFKRKSDAEVDAVLKENNYEPLP